MGTWVRRLYDKVCIVVLKRFTVTPLVNEELTHSKKKLKTNT